MSSQSTTPIIRVNERHICAVAVEADVSFQTARRCYRATHRTNYGNRKRIEAAADKLGLPRPPSARLAGEAQ